MPKVSPNEGAAKLRRRIQGAGQDYLDGVDRVTESPTAKAAQKEDKMRQGILAAIDSGKWRRGLEGVTLADWKRDTKAKGGQRYTASAEQAERNYASFAQDFYPFLQGVQDNIATMPDLTFADRLARVNTALTQLHDYQRP